MKINANFDSGNIEIINIRTPHDVQLKIRKDNNANFFQWFHFCVRGAKGQACQFKIMNAAEATFASCWKKGYRACASYDRKNWFRVPTSYDGKMLTISHTPEYDSVYYAYYYPYSYEQHQNLLSWAQLSPRCHLQDLGQTLDSYPISLLTIGEPAAAKLKLWIIARQHAGEVMGEWFIEGFLERLLDASDPVARALLNDAVFYVVPNMNIDGSIRGHLRANAAGIDLNRSWVAPSLETSPEVYHVFAKMQETGVDFFLDVHGDEELPYNYMIGTAKTLGFTPKQTQVENAFFNSLLQLSPDFQNEYSLSPETLGDQVLNLAAFHVAKTFNCLGLTLEMPFIDHASAPDERYGWSPARSKKLAHAYLDALHAMVLNLRL